VVWPLCGAEPARVMALSEIVYIYERRQLESVQDLNPRQAVGPSGVSCRVVTFIRIMRSFNASFFLLLTKLLYSFSLEYATKFD
jgi:hypothetical protein